nr:hypothetical protein [Tanacetum cinerariifolium]
MDMTIDQQVKFDEALVPHARRLRIERSNFRLLSDISSKESTLQLVYDVLRQTPFFNSFLVTADVPEIYIHEFWATAMVHHYSIRTMDMTTDQQVKLDKALVPHARRLRIERSNFRLLSDISSKESTLQLVYDVLRQTPFFKSFLVTADVPEIYMQEFWATAMVYHYSIRFKMDNKNHIVNLEYFREMLHICPRLPGQTFDELPFE